MNRYLKSFLNVLCSFVQILANWFFCLIYRKKGATMPPIKDLLLLESATSIAHKIRTKKVTSEQVLDSFIDRINEFNPTLNAVVANRFEEARKEARSVDKFIQSGTASESTLMKEKPFLGVPFTTKDCIAVKGMIQTSGLLRRKAIIAEEDADAVAALKDAGAIPIALTNVSELCMWWESYNTVHGRSNNPYDTNRIVGGSSGGEGCCQAAAGSAFGIGSDIGGSIRMPAFFNGVFGHKPSKFVVSNKGQYPIPMSKEQNSFLGIGPLCRRAEDLLPLLKVIIGPKINDLKLDEPVDLTKIRFFYQETDGGSPFVSPVSHEIRNLFKKICLHLKKAHDINVKKVNLKKFSKSTALWMANMKSPSGPKFSEQLANLKGNISPLKELLKWVINMSQHTFIGLMTAVVDDIGIKHGDKQHSYLVEMRDQFRCELNDLLGDDGVFLYPTHPTAAPFHNEPLLKPFNFSYTAIVNVLALPATHIPMGLNEDGVPIGVQVFSNDKNDRLCLAVAREFEKAFGGWVPPKIEV